MKIVLALGGNALLKRGEPLEAEVQLQNIKVAAKAIAAIARSHSVVVTHGNGPQVGLLALQAEAYKDVRPYPLDVLGAETEGAIGYLLERELQNCLPDRQVATLLTQVEVDRNDPAFACPSKFIGPVYDSEEAQKLARERGWAIAADGEVYRRVVPSPEPKRILELGAIQLLLAAGVLVVCGGGGGIPVTVDAIGTIRGVEAVIDKDLAAALLAQKVRADGLLLLTDVNAVYLNWHEAGSRPLERVTAKQLRSYTFASGSMAPKVEAACRFVERSRGWAAIGCLQDAAAILAGQKGTQIVSDRSSF